MIDGHITERWIASAAIQPGSVVVDIGAFIGDATLIYSDLCGASGKVFSLEPVPSTYGKLRENVSHNAWYRNVEALCYAFSDEKGDGLIEIPGKAFSEASLHEHHTGFWAETEERVSFECKLVLMKEFIEARQLTSIEYIRCDTMGAELSILKGAGDYLMKFKPVLNFEYIPEMVTDFGYGAEAIFEVLLHNEYDSFFITPQTIFQHPDIADLEKHVSKLRCNVTAFHSGKHDQLLELIEDQLDTD